MAQLGPAYIWPRGQDHLPPAATSPLPQPPPCQSRLSNLHVAVLNCDVVPPASEFNASFAPLVPQLVGGWVGGYIGRGSRGPCHSGARAPVASGWGWGWATGQAEV